MDASSENVNINGRFANKAVLLAGNADEYKMIGGSNTVTIENNDNDINNGILCIQMMYRFETWVIVLS